ncbi:hypothetical protein AC622_16275 [Bacillus sp. FJAT-27916]|uniref:hypothetical protein n=1 Tax=Bacillaceae TaxID=186817 RepID=UPI0006714C76|nr:hypothetical protein [Bacillus sp. FJAT-27916]KMY45582.1 hypothetical protein AC622_16275 [Bacillus sp. FJAT-27916]
MKKTEKAETIAESRVENGQMAPDLKEMKNLGKQMENLRTNEELANDYGKSPDPVQHEDEEVNDK